MCLFASSCLFFSDIPSAAEGGSGASAPPPAVQAAAAAATVPDDEHSPHTQLEEGEEESPTHTPPVSPTQEDLLAVVEAAGAETAAPAGDA